MALFPAGAYRRCSRWALLAAARRASALIPATWAETACAGGAVAWLAAVPAAAGALVSVSVFLQPANAQATTRPAISRNPADRDGENFAANIGPTPLTVLGRTCA